MFLGVFNWIDAGPLNSCNLEFSGASKMPDEQAITEAGPAGPDIQNRGIEDSGRIPMHH